MDSPLLVERLREVGVGITEEITVRNYSLDPVECVVSLSVEADFADTFEVKEARIQRHWDETRQPDAGSLKINAAWKGVRKGIIFNAGGAADVGADALTYRTVVPPHGHWSTVLSVMPAVDGSGPAAPFVHPAPGDMSPRDRRRMEWVARIPVLQMGNGSIELTLQRSYDDLGAGPGLRGPRRRWLRRIWPPE